MSDRHHDRSTGGSPASFNRSADYDRGELERLAAVVIDQRATEEECRRLAAWLRSDIRALDDYLAYVDTHAWLATEMPRAVTSQPNSNEAAALSAAPVQTRTHSGPVPTGRRLAERGLAKRGLNGFGPAGRRTILVAFAASAAAILFGMFYFRGDDIEQRDLAASVQCLGGGLTMAGRPVQVQHAAAGVEYRLDQGVAHLQYPQGVHVIVEAPATFCCLSQDRLRVQEGRVSAEVLAGAEGFQVETPEMNVVDLGTRFGVAVSKDGDSEVHVFEGEVEAAPATGTRAMKRLVQGQAQSVSQQGNADNRTFRNAGFVHREEVQEFQFGWKAERMLSARQAAAKLRADPSLVAYDDFAEVPAGTTASVAQGRFPGETALEFLRANDYAPIDVAGTYPQLTMMAWVRLDHVPDGFNSIYHADGWATTGQVHWMVVRGRQMRFAVHDQSRVPETIWPESEHSIIGDLGRWVHLATVYDSQEKVVRFFINGQFDHQVSLDVAPEAVLGPAQIGNWNPAYRKQPIEVQHDRRLSGRIDELAIIGRSMSDQEINAYYAAGTPYAN